MTGQRRDEVAGMTWKEIDVERRLWTLPPGRTKSNRPHEVPLSDAAIAVLELLPRIAGDYVLTTNGTSPSSGYSKGKRRLDALLPPDVPEWRLHDLRRTAASGMARLGINLPVIEKVLNHSSGSFAGMVRSIKSTNSRMRNAARWRRGGASLPSLSDRPRKNVVALRKGRADA